MPASYQAPEATLLATSGVGTWINSAMRLGHTFGFKFRAVRLQYICNGHYSVVTDADVCEGHTADSGAGVASCGSQTKQWGILGCRPWLLL